MVAHSKPGQAAKYEGVSTRSARRRLQHRVLMASAVFSSLVPRIPSCAFQLREALATTVTPGSRSFCGHFPHRARPRNEGFVPSVLYDDCGVFLAGDVKALGR